MSRNPGRPSDTIGLIGPERERLWAVARDGMKLALLAATAFLLVTHVVAKWFYAHSQIGVLIADLTLNLTAAGVVSLVVTFFLARYREAEKEDVQQRLADAVNESMAVHLVGISGQLERLDGTQFEKSVIESRFLGVRRLEGALTSTVCAERFRAARRRIDVLNVWIPGLHLLTDPLSIALRAGVKVRLIVQHLDSKAIELRTQALGERTSIKVMQAVEDNLETLEDWASRENATEEGRAALRSLSTRYNMTFPPFSMYLIDDEIHVGFYWGRQPAVHGHQIIVDAGSLLGREIMAEFELVWTACERNEDILNWRRSKAVPYGPASLLPGADRRNL